MIYNIHHNSFLNECLVFKIRVVWKNNLRRYAYLRAVVKGRVKMKTPVLAILRHLLWSPVERKYFSGSLYVLVKQVLGN